MKSKSLYLPILASVILGLGACTRPNDNNPPPKIEAVNSWATLGHVSAMPDALSHGTIAINGAEIYYAVYGEGAPLVLLHGGLGNTESWANQIPALSREYQVIAIDSRGHGRSTRNNAVYTIDLLTKDVLAVMNHLNVSTAKILGWSDGANIAVNLAMRHPSRVEKVFAFGANYNVAGSRDDYEENPIVGAFIEKAQNDYARLSATPDEFEDFVGALTAGMWEHEPNFTPDQLGAITLPIAVAFGEHDEFIQLQHAKDMAALIPNSELILFPNGSHFMLWQDPKAFNAHVLKFLKQ